MREVKSETAYSIMRQTLFDMGMRDDEAIHRTAKLAGYIVGEETLTKKEKDRWRELQVLDDAGALKISDVEDSMEWLLIAMTWQGILERVQQVRVQS